MTIDNTPAYTDPPEPAHSKSTAGYKGLFKLLQQELLQALHPKGEQVEPTGEELEAQYSCDPRDPLDDGHTW